MKTLLFSIFCTILSVSAFAQKYQMLTVNGGYAWADVKINQQPNATGNGWRAHAHYEYNPNEGAMAFGFALGYVHLASTVSNAQTENAEVTVNTIPAYLTIKGMFGSDRLKGFLQASAGMQFASFELDSPIEDATGNDFGLYGGGAAGLMFYLRDNLYLNAQYDLAYLTNSYYRDGLLQTATAGVGFRF